MTTLLKLVKSSVLIGFFTIALVLGGSFEAKAQPAPLAINNTTNCPIWVQGQTGQGLTPGCMTAWIYIAPFSTGTIPPCAGPSWSWYHVNYTMCMPPGFCPIGMTNSPVAICGMPAVMIPDCNGGTFNPIWTSMPPTYLVTF